MFRYKWFKFFLRVSATFLIKIRSSRRYENYYIDIVEEWKKNRWVC